MTEKFASWWTEGNRKFLTAVAALVVFGAVAITLLITQPKGVDLMEFLQWAGGLLFGGQGLFSLANLFEHKIKANSTPSALGKAGLVLAMLLAIFPLASCASSNTHTLASTLSAGEAVAQTAKAQALERGSTTGCYAATLSAAALASTAAALTAQRDHSGSALIPGIKVDYTPCAEGEGFDALLGQHRAEVVKGYLAAMTAVVRVLSGYLSGELECSERVWTLALIAYLEQAAAEVFEELSAPDGLVVVESVVVDVGACGG